MLSQEQTQTQTPASAAATTTTTTTKTTAAKSIVQKKNLLSLNALIDLVTN